MGPFARHAVLERAVPIAGFVLAFVLGRAAAAGFPSFPLDDAWIHLSYAKSLRLGDGLSYNPGDWETGFSSPLWVLVLALVPWGTAPAPAVAWVGAFFFGLGAYAATRFVRDVCRAAATDDAPVPVLSISAATAVCAAVSPVGQLAAASGMEVCLAYAASALLLHALWFGTAPVAAVAAALAVLARPEALVFAGALGAVAALRGERRRAGIFAAFGAVAAMALWSGYCLAVSGAPLPNTYYVKAGRGGPAGFAYLVEEVLSWQPEVVSLAGVVLLGLCVRWEIRGDRRHAVSTLVAIAATFAAIVAGRPLHPGVGFYEARYFAPWAILLTALVPLGLAGVRRSYLGAAGVLLVVAVGAVQGRDLLARGRAMAEDVVAVHEAPARWIAAHLPEDARVAVEGAGATRFFTPRSMVVVDVVGLNTRRLARLHHDRRAKLCALVDMAPEYFVIPTNWRELFAPAFELREIRTFFDPAYVQVDPPRPHRVGVFAATAAPSNALGCP